MKNIVIEGDYKGSSVLAMNGGIVFQKGFSTEAMIDKYSVEEYEVMDSEKKTSGVSAVSRAAVGSFFLGPAGLLLGATAKKKGVHIIALQFKDSKKSLVEVDDKIYKALIKVLF